MSERFGKESSPKKPAEERESLRSVFDAADPFLKVTIARDQLEKLRTELIQATEVRDHAQALLDAAPGHGAGDTGNLNAECEKIEKEIKLWGCLLDDAEEAANRELDSEEGSLH